MKLWLLFFLLTACGSGGTSCWYKPAATEDKPAKCTTKQIARRINKETLSLVSEFSADAIARNIPCYQIASLDFQPKRNPDNPEQVGYCILGMQIRFVEEYWDGFSLPVKRTLVYHELGHCALHLGHTSEDEVDIMNPYLLPRNVTEPMWPDLVNKLFDPERKKI